MSKVRLLSLALGLMLLINLTLIFLMFFGRPEGPPRGPLAGGRGEPRHVIIRRLHFDERQITTYEELIRKHRIALRELEGEIRKTKTALYKTLSDEHQIGRDSLENHLGVLQRNMEGIHYNHFAEIRTICRPDQVLDFNALSRELAGFFDPAKKLPLPPKD
jgi:periplasmic protein CpxP/Spy